MKILKYFAMMAAVVGMTAACQKEEFVTFDSANVVAPTLHVVKDIVVTVDNKDSLATFTWDAADFGVKSQVYYSLNMAKGDVSVNLFSDISGTTTATVSYDNINNKAYNDLKIADGELTEVTFTLGAKLNVGEMFYSSPVIGKVAPTAAEKVYKNIWVIGNYCSWEHGQALYLWNYAEDDDVFMGVVDFGEDATIREGGFKITPANNWDAEFGGTGTADAEPASIPVVTSGGSDIKNFTAKRFYHLSLGTKALTLTKNYSFDQIGIIGLNNDWNTDVVMTYSSYKQRFYADIDVAADTEMKFRADASWDNFDLGGDVKSLAKGGGDIAVKAGKYRVYLNMNNLDAITCTFDESAYGTEEGGPAVEPEPEPVETTYGLIGNFNDWADPDVNLVARTDGFYVANAVEIPADDENKILIRLNDAYDEKFGFAEADTYLQLGKNTLTAGGNDMWINEGTYDFYFNPTTAELYLANAGDADPTLPSDAKAVKIYGDVSTAGWVECNAYIWDADGNYAGDWPGKALEKETLDGKEYYVFNADASMYGKTVNVIFNNGTEQTVDITGVVLNNDVIIALTEKDTDGKWQVTIDGETPEAPDMSGKTWYLVGNFNGWNPRDANYAMTAEGDFFVFKNWTVAAEYTHEGNTGPCEVKFAPGEWNGDKGGAFAVNTACSTSSDNIIVPAGTYDVYLSKDLATFYFMTDGKTPADAE